MKVTIKYEVEARVDAEEVTITCQTLEEAERKMKVKQGLILNDSDCDIARLEDLDGFSDLEDDDIEEEKVRSIAGNGVLKIHSVGRMNITKRENQLSKILNEACKIDTQQHIFNNENFSYGCHWFCGWLFFKKIAI